MAAVVVAFLVEVTRGGGGGVVVVRPATTLHHSVQIARYICCARDHTVLDMSKGAPPITWRGERAGEGARPAN